MPTESGIILPADSVGKATRTETVTTTFTTGVGGTVHMPVGVIGDPTTAANLLVVDASGRITTKVVDGSGNALTSTAAGSKQSIDVNIAGSAGGSTSASGTVSASALSTVTGTTTSTSIVVCPVSASGNATVTLSGGTYTVLQLAFEACSDGSGTVWFPIDATRTDGSGVDPGLSSIFFSAATHAWNLYLPGYTHVRVRVNSINETVAPSIAIFPGPTLFDPSPVVAPVDGQKQTFVASVNGMSTTIASDIFALTGSSTKLVRLTRVEVYCVAGAATTSTLALIKRSTADTAGTTSAATVLPLSSAFNGATATAIGYTVAPTLGTTVGPVRLWRGSVATTGTGVTWDFGNRPSSAPVLLNTSQQICLNNGTAIGTSGSWNILFEWTEE